jgi:nucleotide-binding universal stress UspA family protein
MPAPHEDRIPRIVVGVDGSPSSLEALRWAVRQAELTHAIVDAVTAWQFPAGYAGFEPFRDPFDRLMSLGATGTRTPLAMPIDSYRSDDGAYHVAAAAP